MKRILTISALGVAAVLGLGACATSPADVSDEAYALQAVGLDTGLAAAPAPSASAAPKAGDHRRAIRQYLRKNTLHGEVTMKNRTIVVQRGTVTAVTAKTVSVKSTDGFTLTWTFGDKLRVVQDKKAVATSALKNGVQLGVAGTKDGSVTSARLISLQK